MFIAAGLFSGSMSVYSLDDPYNTSPSAMARVSTTLKPPQSTVFHPVAHSVLASTGSSVLVESRVQQAQKLLSNVSDKASDVVLNALQFIGVRYSYGGNTPESGLDCSGFVRYVFQNAASMMLPRRSEEMSRVGKRVARNELKPGDLVFFNTMRRSFSHVGIYIGGDKFVHSPSTGGKIRVENISQSYWMSRYNGARRVESLASNCELTRVETLFKNECPM
nr:C40 family peptidase [Candidatus Pandoraea novymonadis]